MPSLREQFDVEAAAVPALGDIDAALAQVSAQRRTRRRAGVAGLAAAAAVVIVALAGLRSAPQNQAPATGPSDTPRPTSSEQTTTPDPTQGPSVARFSSTSFVAPFSIDPPRSLGHAIEPVETARSVTWQQCINDYCHITSVVAPLAFRPPTGVLPGGTGTDGLSPMLDYAAYVRYLSALNGGYATASDWSTTTIAGRTATVVTLTVSKSVPQSLGCTSNVAAPSGCWGLVPGYPTRVAVIDTGATPLIILSTNSDVQGDEYWSEHFEQRLASLRLGS